MSKYVPDVMSHRWVILSPSRLDRPEDNFKHAKGKNKCPFCPDNEKGNGPDALRYPEDTTKAWQLRVIANQYPITDFHEVIIHSPHHDKDFLNFSLEQIELIFHAYRDRYNFYKKKGQVLIFCNHGEHAGASQAHSHSQLVVIPFQINIDALTQEPIANVVQEDEFFHVYCPDFSQWPYEAWVTPKEETTVFGDITDKQITHIAQILQKLLVRMQHIYETHCISSFPFAYNFYIYPGKKWYLRVIPRFVHRAGFELGTGLLVNIVDPIEAAIELKGLEKKIVNVLEKLKKY